MWLQIILKTWFECSQWSRPQRISEARDTAWSGACPLIPLSPLISPLQAAIEKRSPPPSMLMVRNLTSRKSRGSGVFWRQPTSATSATTRLQSRGCTPVRVTIYLGEIYGIMSGPSTQLKRTGLPRGYSFNTEAWTLLITLEISTLSGLMWSTHGWLCWALISPLEVYSVRTLCSLWYFE